MDKRRALKKFDTALAKVDAVREELLLLKKELGLEGGVSTPPKNSRKSKLVAIALGNRNKTIQRRQGHKKASQGSNL